MRIVQISDCHVTAPGELVADRVDPGPALTAAIDAIHRIDDVELVVATGDLVNDGSPAEYDRLAELLEPLRPPLVVLPGNHDVRAELRARFGAPGGAPDEPIDHVVELDGLALVCLDSSHPGRHDGHLDPSQLDWLDRTLAELAPTPTVVIQHHPMFDSGLPFMDRPFPLRQAAEQRELIARHPHVVAAWSGHVHRHAQCVVGAALVSSAPSTAVSLAAAFGSDATLYSDEPCGLLVHDLVVDAMAPAGPRCVTRFVAVGETDRWTPNWFDT